MSEPIRIPPDALDPATLQALVEEFVTREGTDYGAHEVPTSVKVERALAAVESGRVVIVFDERLNSATLVKADQLT